ncbi:substrate-binding domain-containing protein [Bacteroides luti]|uniref:substrate-binding domain-containing protein n=1 Tax=Bacteroides luti TaxID=1297750 RepID=UPI00373FDE4D
MNLSSINPLILRLDYIVIGKNYVAPNMANAAKKTYPVIRQLFYYYNSKEKNKVSQFIQYVLSPEGQNLIKKSGYIPVRLM